MSRVSLKELESFVENTKFSSEPLRFNQCSVIQDRRKFAESHLSIIKANSGNKAYLPYYERLVKFYKMIKDE